MKWYSLPSLYRNWTGGFRGRPAAISRPPGRTLDRLAALDVAQLDAHLGRAPADLDVVVVEDLPQLVFELDDEAPLQISGRNHGEC